MRRSGTLLLLFVAVCGISPAVAATVLALLKGARVLRAGHPLGNETIAVGIFGWLELLVVSVLVALPAAFVCEFAVKRRQSQNALRRLFVGAAATLIFSCIYAVAWGSISWHLAALWAFAFITWPPLVFPRLRIAAA